MEVPFSGFEITFIILAFVIFSLFSLASVCIQKEEDAAYEDKKLKQLVKKKQREISKQAGQKA
uniref:Small integral membrane protein 31 n=1 Tax=Xiphophorus couchianus TaxID=32473 RepID=A0A3B5KR95_9TELE